MKRTILSLFSIVVMAMAGSAVAQTGADTTDQTGTAAPAPTATDTPVAQQDSPTTEPAAPAGDPTTEPAAAQPASDMGAAASGDAGQAADAGKLPATASNSPLLALLGALALGAFTVLLVVRRRGAAKS